MQYAYLFFTSLFFIPWAYFFISRKDLRFEMLWAGVIVAILGLIGEKIWYTSDWVSPTTLTGTIVGVEDLIMGFAAGGISAVVYKTIFNKDDYKSEGVKIRKKYYLILVFLFILILTDFLFRFAGLFSFYANLIGFGLMAVLFLIIRSDLWMEGITGGLLLVLITLPIYWVSFYLFPDWRESYWRMDQISQTYFLRIPYEDIIWWFFAGINISIAYDEFNGLRIRKLKEDN
jgi:hypothetical protein